VGFVFAQSEEGGAATAHLHGKATRRQELISDVIEPVPQFPCRHFHAIEEMLPDCPHIAIGEGGDQIIRLTKLSIMKRHTLGINAGGGQSFRWFEKNKPKGRHWRKRLNPFTSSFADCGNIVKKYGTVASDFGGNRQKFGIGNIKIPHPARQSESRGGIAGPSPKPA